MVDSTTTLAVQHYLDALAEDRSADLAIRDLLARAAKRLHKLCSILLLRSYPRLTRPPMSLEADDLFGAVVERLMKALQKARPKDTRQFFSLASQHMRWELNDLARRLDAQPCAVELTDSNLRAPLSSEENLSPVVVRIFAAIDSLPEEERESFDLVRVQGLSQAEAANILGVSVMTVSRRVNRSVIILSELLDDLHPADREPHQIESPPDTEPLAANKRTQI